MPTTSCCRNAKRSPGEAEFTYLLGRAALGSGRAEAAQALLEQSLATRPGDVEAHLALGPRAVRAG